VWTTGRSTTSLSRTATLEQANRHRRPLSFSVGDQVKLSTEYITLLNQPSSKLRDRFLGPFPVTEVVSPVSYRLALPTSMRVHPVFHVSRLLPWIVSPEDEFSSRHIPDQPVPAAREFIYGDTYIAQSIVDVKIAVDPTSRARPKASGLFFRVKWGPPYSDPSEDSWEPMRNLSRLDVFKQFLASSAWKSFAASAAYQSFAAANKSKIPKAVHFA